jgi:hypothetical protein
MKTRTLKDSHEERVLNLLKKHLCLDLVFHTKSESPDFILHRDSGDIGVEIVELLDPDKKVLSSVKSILTNKVIEKLKTRLPYPFVVNIDFEPSDTAKPNNSKRVNELVKLFVNLGKDLQDLGQIQFNKFDGDFDEFPVDIQQMILGQGFIPLPDGVLRINISRFDYLEESFNSQRESGLVPALTFEKIQKEIDKKNEKLPCYQKFAEHWLVLEEGNGMSGYYSQIPKQEIFESDFDHIFIVRMIKDEIVELKTKNLSKV